MLVVKSYPTLFNPMDCSPPGSSVHGSSGKNTGSGLSFPSPGDLSNLGIELKSPTLRADSLPSEPLGKPVAQTDKKSGLSQGSKIAAHGSDLNHSLSVWFYRNAACLYKQSFTETQPGPLLRLLQTGCFHASTAQPSSHDRDHVVPKT